MIEEINKLTNLLNMFVNALEIKANQAVYIADILKQLESTLIKLKEKAEEPAVSEEKVD